MVKKRNYVLTIVLMFVTFGIYGLYWIYRLAKDVNTICDGDGKQTGGLLKFVLFGIITLGIYDYIWIYRLGDRLQDNASKFGLAFKESGGIILIWFLLGSFIIVGPFIALHIIIKNTNALAEEYNKRFTP